VQGMGAVFVNNVLLHINTSKYHFAVTKGRCTVQKPLTAKGRLPKKKKRANRAQRGEGIAVLSGEAQLLLQMDTEGVISSQDIGAAGHEC